MYSTRRVCKPPPPQESEQSRVSQCEGDVRQFQERAGQLQSESTQLSSEVASLQQRVRSCEDSLPDLQAKADGEGGGGGDC